jgi:uncharacterized protein (UPF0335 family)
MNDDQIERLITSIEKISEELHELKNHVKAIEGVLKRTPLK